MTNLRDVCEQILKLGTDVGLPWRWEANRREDCDLILATDHQVARTFNTDGGTCRDTSFIVHACSHAEALAREYLLLDEVAKAAEILKKWVDKEFDEIVGSGSHIEIGAEEYDYLRVTLEALRKHRAEKKDV